MTKHNSYVNSVKKNKFYLTPTELQNKAANI